MNYSDLPLSQRIEMASDYAILLIEDSVFEENIVSNLQATFSLTQEQAFEALQRTKSNRSSEYKRLQNASILKALGSIVTAVACGIFYLAAGDEIGVIFICLGIFFLGGGLLILSIVIQMLLDKFFYSPTLIKNRMERKKNPKKDVQDWTVQIFTVGAFFFAIAFFNYQKKSGWVDIKKLKTVSLLQLDLPLQKKSTGGKSPTHYYVFHFRNYPNEFQLHETYYNYAGKTFDAHSLTVGDIIGIQVNKSDYNNKLVYSNNTDEVDIINLIINDHALIDLEWRNEKVLLRNKRFCTITGWSCIFLLLVMIIRHKVAADKDLRNSLNNLYPV